MSRVLFALLILVVAIWGLSLVIVLIFGGFPRSKKASEITARDAHPSREFRSGRENAKGLHVVEGILLAPCTLRGRSFHHVLLPDALEGEGRMLSLYLPAEGTEAIDLVEEHVAQQKAIGRAWVVIDLEDGDSRSADVAFHLRTRKEGMRTDPMAEARDRLGVDVSELGDGDVLLAVLHLGWGLDGRRIGANYAHWTRDEEGPRVDGTASVHVDFFLCRLDLKRVVRPSPSRGVILMAKALAGDVLLLPQEAFRIVATLLGGPGVV